MVTKKGMGGYKLRVSDQQIQTTMHKKIDEQGPTVQHREYIQYPVINHNGREYVYMCN